MGLIERWYELSDSSHTDAQAVEGEIRVGGSNINDLDLKWWRSQIGLVQQEPVLFNDTIFNNVAFGLLDSQRENESEAVKVDLVTTACKESFADDFIQYLPLVRNGNFTMTHWCCILTVFEGIFNIGR